MCNQNAIRQLLKFCADQRTESRKLVLQWFLSCQTLPIDLLLILQIGPTVKRWLLVQWGPSGIAYFSDALYYYEVETLPANKRCALPAERLGFLPTGLAAACGAAGSPPRLPTAAAQQPPGLGNRVP